MRYFIVKYRQIVLRKGQKLEPQTDEIVELSNKLKMRDYQSAAVILDFKERRVLQASMDGHTIPRDWQKIRNFYHQHYPKIINDLEILHWPQDLQSTESKPDIGPATNL